MATNGAAVPVPSATVASQTAVSIPSATVTNQMADPKPSAVVTNQRTVSAHSANALCQFNQWDCSYSPFCAEASPGLSIRDSSPGGFSLAPNNSPL